MAHTWRHGANYEILVGLCVRLSDVLTSFRTIRKSWLCYCVQNDHDACYIRHYCDVHISSSHLCSSAPWLSKFTGIFLHGFWVAGSLNATSHLIHCHIAHCTYKYDRIFNIKSLWELFLYGLWVAGGLTSISHIISKKSPRSSLLSLT